MEEKRKPQKTLFYWSLTRPYTPKAWKQRWSFWTRMTICTGGRQQLSPLHSSWLKSTAAKVSLQDNQHAIVIYYHSTGSMQDMGHKFSLWVQLEDEETHLLKDQVRRSCLKNHTRSLLLVAPNNPLKVSSAPALWTDMVRSAHAWSAAVALNSLCKTGIEKTDPLVDQGLGRVEEAEKSRWLWTPPVHLPCV